MAQAGRSGIAALVGAFRNSCAGLSHALRTERAVRQEAVALLAALPLSLIVGFGLWQRVALVGVVLLVLVAELLNTAIEKLADHVTPELHPQIGIVKDLASAGVLCALALAGLVWLAALAERFGFA
jgi:diacylglycerol kinase (ATP)